MTSLSEFVGVFDITQHKKYYKALCYLINSQDFQIYSPKNKNRVIEEQMRIYRLRVNR